jgi:hypothetical protein
LSFLGRKRGGINMRILLISTLLFCTTTSNVQDLRKFVGNWRVDENRSLEKATPVKNPPPGAPQIPPPPPAQHKYTVEHIHRSGEILKISGGEAGTTAVYTIDLSGKQVSDPIPDAPGVQRIAISGWEHQKIVTEWKMLRNGEIFMHGSDTHYFTHGGHLIVERTIESPSHTAEVRLVLDRMH